jgi:hypothetical protein
MAGIFISYRRADAGGHAGRLCDRLTARFGADRVFLDIQDIHPGQNYAESIEDTIAACECVIAVIGPHWLETIRTRAQSSADFVRQEIAAALRRGVTVIPVLVGGARMPVASDLPAELADLSLRNAVEIRDERFDRDVEELETFLDGLVHGAKASPSRRDGPGRRPLVLAIAAVAVACVVAVYLRVRPAPTVEITPVSAAPVIDGDWVAEMHKPNQPVFRIRLQFERVGESLGGVVHYPTGDGPMHDVTLNGRTLNFATTHVPQFASDPVTIRFQAEVSPDEIRLIETDPGGVGTGVARRAAPR